jgi:hypothetical protein
MASAGMWAGCDRGNPKVDSSGTPVPLRIQATSPANEESNVPLDRSIRIRFDRFLDPATAVRQSIQVTGGTFDPDGGAALAGNNFLEPIYDVVERVVTFRLPRVKDANGNEQQALWQPRVRYTVTLSVPSDSGGFRAWDGTGLSETVTFSFTTADDASSVPDPKEATSAKIAFCSSCSANKKTPGINEFFSGACVQGPCHSPAASKGPASGLDLSSGAIIKKAVLGQSAHGTLSSPTAFAQDSNGKFGRNMPLIDPGSPGNSYVIYKILINERLWETTEESAYAAFGLGDLRPSAEELARLRGFVSIGEPMPLDGKLSPTDVRFLQTWIAQGAPVEDNACTPIFECGFIPRDKPNNPLPDGGTDGGDAGDGG